MKTLEELKGRCVIEDGDDGGEHWIWQGATRDGTPNIWAPNYTLDETGATMTVQTGVRAMLHVSTGRPIPPRKQAYRVCLYPLCINPACVECGTKKQWGKMVAKTGREKGRHSRVIAGRRNSAVQSKITPAIAADILASMAANERVAVTAARLNMHRDTLTRVRMGRSIGAMQQNPFAGLMR